MADAYTELEASAAALPLVMGAAATWRDEPWWFRQLLRRVAERIQANVSRLVTLESATSALQTTTGTLTTNVATLTTATNTLGQRATSDETNLTALGQRTTNLEGSTALQIQLHVAATLTDLPASASVRDWWRVAGDPAVYIGNGANKPLTKLSPAAL